jgi:hypothetical protein
VGKPEEKRSLGGTISRLADNIKLDIRVIEWSGMDWTDLAQNREQWGAVVNAVTSLRDP